MNDNLVLVLATGNFRGKSNSKNSSRCNLLATSPQGHLRFQDGGWANSRSRVSKFWLFQNGGGFYGHVTCCSLRRREDSGDETCDILVPRATRFFLNVVTNHVTKRNGGSGDERGRRGWFTCTSGQRTSLIRTQSCAQPRSQGLLGRTISSPEPARFGQRWPTRLLGKYFK